MIYLVGGWHRARMWGIDEDVDVSPHNKDIQLVTDLSRAHGHRPRPSDRIVLLEDGSGEAYRRLVYERELARRRRDNSLRQAP